MMNMDEALLALGLDELEPRHDASMDLQNQP
jgi:hypothetical protein